jgi:anti-sigma regulatory factor (Ser/Thr protein kinase)
VRTSSVKTGQAILPIPADAAAIGHARSFTAAFLRDHGVAGLSDTVVLLVSELVTNALLHSSSSAELRLLLTKSDLRVEVRDKSPATPYVKQYSDTATTGRGMLIVDTLAKSWGAKAENSGKVVWFTMDVASEFDRPVAVTSRTRGSAASSSRGSAAAGYRFSRSFASAVNPLATAC